MSNRLSESLKQCMAKRGKYVYFIRCNEFVKVGIGDDPAERLAYMQTGCPYRLEIIHCYRCDNARDAESSLHELYAKHWERGEWFRLPGDEISRLTALGVPDRLKPKSNEPLPLRRRYTPRLIAYAPHKPKRTSRLSPYYHSKALQRIVGYPLPAMCRHAGRIVVDA